MKDSKTYGLPIFALLFLLGCRNGETPVDNESISDRYYNLRRMGWKSKSVTQQIGNYLYTATEVPLQYYLLRQAGHENLEVIDSLYEIHKDERVIEVEFSNVSGDDMLKSKYTRLDYESGVKYMSFKINNDFSVVTSDKDTISCQGLHFERNFKVAPFHRVLLYFNKINPNDELQLVYHDHLYGQGLIKFNFKQTPIQL